MNTDPLRDTVWAVARDMVSGGQNFQGGFASYRTKGPLRHRRRMLQFAPQLHRHCAWRIPKRLARDSPGPSASQRSQYLWPLFYGASAVSIPDLTSDSKPARSLDGNAKSSRVQKWQTFESCWQSRVCQKGPEHSSDILHPSEREVIEPCVPAQCPSSVFATLLRHGLTRVVSF